MSSMWCGHLSAIFPRFARASRPRLAYMNTACAASLMQPVTHASQAAACAPRSVSVAHGSMAPTMFWRPRPTLTQPAVSGSAAPRPVAFGSVRARQQRTTVCAGAGADGPSDDMQGAHDPAPTHQDSSSPGSVQWNSEAALRTLGLGPGANFDQILAARNALQATNPAAGATYEMAYDHLLQR